MSIIINIFLPLAAGVLLGGVYFGGLWLTLRRLPQAGHPALLIVASYFGRLALCLAGLLLVSYGGSWQRLLACLAGLAGARILLVRRLGPRGYQRSGAAGLASKRTA